MSTQTEICAGCQYLINGTNHKTITLTHKLIPFKNIVEKRKQHFQSHNFQRQFFQKETTPFKPDPSQRSNARFIRPSEHHVIENRRKYYYVIVLNSFFGDSLPVKSTMPGAWKLSRRYGDPSPSCYTSIWRWTRLCRTHGWSPFLLLRKKSMPQTGKLTSETDSLLRKQENALLIKSPSANTVRRRMKNFAVFQPKFCALVFLWHKNI